MRNWSSRSIRRKPRIIPRMLLIPPRFRVSTIMARTRSPLVPRRTWMISIRTSRRISLGVSTRPASRAHNRANAPRVSPRTRSNSSTSSTPSTTRTPTCPPRTHNRTTFSPGTTCFNWTLPPTQCREPRATPTASTSPSRPPRPIPRRYSP